MAVQTQPAVEIISVATIFVIFLINKVKVLFTCRNMESLVRTGSISITAN